jgi:hypothetical protein
MIYRVVKEFRAGENPKRELNAKDNNADVAVF